MAMVATRVADWHAVKALTDRVMKRKKAYLEAKPILCPERSRLFRQSWQETEGDPLDVRYAKALLKIVREIPVTIREDELITGSLTTHIRGCYAWPEYFADALLDLPEDAESGNTGECRQSILEDAQYWKDRSVYSRIRKRYQQLWGDKMEQAQEAKLWFARTAFDPPSSSTPDYGKVLTKGLKGVIGEARDELNTPEVMSGRAVHKAEFLEGVIIACEAMIEYAKRHAALARQLSLKETNPTRKKELEEIADICEWVPENPARSFHEALQCFWFAHLGHALETGTPLGLSLGRFDQYMYPFYAADIVSGKITLDQAAEFLGLLWVKLSETQTYRAGRWDKGDFFQGTTEMQNLTIGGVTSDGRDATNDLSYLVLETRRQVKVPQPPISLRYHDGMSEDFLILAAETNRDKEPAYLPFSMIRQLYLVFVGIGECPYLRHETGQFPDVYSGIYPGLRQISTTTLSV